MHHVAWVGKCGGNTKVCAGGGAPPRDTPSPGFANNYRGTIWRKLLVSDGVYARIRGRKGGPQFELRSVHSDEAKMVPSKPRTDKLVGMPSLEPAQHEDPSPKAAPPNDAMSVPPRSYTSTRAIVGVAWDTASRVVDAATPHTLSTFSAHTCSVLASQSTQRHAHARGQQDVNIASGIRVCQRRAKGSR